MTLVVSGSTAFVNNTSITYSITQFGLYILTLSDDLIIVCGHHIMHKKNINNQVCFDVGFSLMILLKC